MSKSACSRPSSAGHYGIGEATNLYLLGFYPVTSGLWHRAPFRGKTVNHSGVRWQCHLQNHNSENVWGHQSNILLCFFVFRYILCGPLCWFIPEARSRCALSLSFMWAVTCTCPFRNNLYLRRVRHTWTGGHRSLGRLFKTNQLLQPTCLQPTPQRSALLATCQHIGAFTSRQDDPGVKKDMGSEPGGKKYKVQYIISN